MGVEEFGALCLVMACEGLDAVVDWTMMDRVMKSRKEVDGEDVGMMVQEGARGRTTSGRVAVTRR